MKHWAQSYSRYKYYLGIKAGIRQAQQEAGENSQVLVRLWKTARKTNLQTRIFGGQECFAYKNVLAVIGLLGRNVQRTGMFCTLECFTNQTFAGQESFKDRLVCRQDCCSTEYFVARNVLRTGMFCIQEWFTKQTFCRKKCLKDRNVMIARMV